MRPILIIDNFDSFVHILADEFRQRVECVDVLRSSVRVADVLDYVRRNDPALVVLSPGPGHPAEATLCLQVLTAVPQRVPILGVCLGHQCLVHHCGGQVAAARAPVHGKPSPIVHDGTGLFAGVPSPMRVGRYHSLVATTLPDELVVTARCGDEVMAVRHVSRPLWGVQFHPESILTPAGGLLIDNMLGLTEIRDAA